MLCFWYIQILGELLVCSRLGKSWKWVMAYHGRSSPSFSMRSRHQSSAWKATHLGRDGAGVTIPILVTFDMSKVISSKSSHHICDMSCSISGNFQISFGCACKYVYIYKHRHHVNGGPVWFSMICSGDSSPMRVLRPSPPRCDLGRVVLSHCMWCISKVYIWNGNKTCWYVNIE